jgi:hypothetical protein
MIIKSSLLATAVALSLPAVSMAQNNVARGAFVTESGTPQPNSVFAPNATITEAFDTVTGTPPCPAGWTCTNNSTPIGSTNWFQGNDTVFPAQAGAPTAYIGTNFNNVAGNATISNWLISPVVQFGGGSELRFWSRTVDTINYADRLEIRASTGGTNTGGTNVSTGDFSILLGTINTSLSTATGTCASPAGPPNAGGYPNVWCEYRITNTEGIPTTGSGRIAFRYFVTAGGPTGANSDFIGIDTFSFVEGSTTAAPIFAYSPAPAATVPFTGGTTVGSTATASIAVSVGTAGVGTGAAATTTTTCTAPTAPFTGFGQTVTAEGAGAISGGPLTGSCTLGATAVTQTLTCSENQGGTPVVRTFELNCPAGTAVPITSTPVSGSLVTLPAQVLGGPATTFDINFQNPGVAAATVTCTAPTATQFTVAPLTFSVPAAGNASTTVTYSSAVIGTFTGVLNCTSGAQNFTFNLTGTTGGAARAVPVGGNGLNILLALATLALGGLSLGFYTRRS